MGDDPKGMGRRMLIRRLTEVVNDRVVWSDKSKSWLRNDPDLGLSMIKRGLMESGFGLDPVLETFVMPSSWRQKGTDGKVFDIGVDVYEDSTFNIMYDLKENWVYMDGCDVDPLNFWDHIYECFELRLGCDLNEMYRKYEG